MNKYIRLFITILQKFKRHKQKNNYRKLFVQKYKNKYLWPQGEYSFSNMDLAQHSYGVLNIEFAKYGVLKIGQCVSISKDVVFLLDACHSMKTLSTFPFDVYYSDSIRKTYREEKNIEKLKERYSITIEDDVWIGMRVTILPGVTIHQGAVVGACSVVTKDVPPYAIVAGNPAKIIRYRFSQEIIEKLIKYANYSKLTDKKVQDNLDFLLNTELTEENIDTFLTIFK